MRVLGIDPGPNGFAWAIYDSEKSDIVEWGDDAASKSDYVVIEDIQSYGNMIGKSTLDTAKTIGKIQGWYPEALLLPRKAIAQVLGGSVRAGDKAINYALGKLIPSFSYKRRGLNGHHRAAAACAYVGYGRIKSQEILKNAILPLGLSPTKTRQVPKSPMLGESADHLRRTQGG